MAFECCAQSFGHRRGALIELAPHRALLAIQLHPGKAEREQRKTHTQRHSEFQAEAHVYPIINPAGG
jgi:hypothetical protein